MGPTCAPEAVGLNGSDACPPDDALVVAVGLAAGAVDAPGAVEVEGDADGWEAVHAAWTPTRLLRRGRGMAETILSAR